MKRRKDSTDTITLLRRLGFQSIRPGVWSDGQREIREVAAELNPYELKVGGHVDSFPSLIAVYQHLHLEAEKGRL